jgi:hypothetical protein
MSFPKKKFIMVLKANLKYHNILYVVEEKKINICGKIIYKNILKILKKNIYFILIEYS